MVTRTHTYTHTYANLLKKQLGAGEMAELLRTLVGLTENLVSIPSTYMVGTQPSKSSSRGPDSLFLASESTAHTYYTDTHAGQT